MMINYPEFTIEEFQRDNPELEVPFIQGNLDSAVNGVRINTLEISDSSFFSYRVKVRECNDTSLVIGGLPAGFSRVMTTRARIVGTNIHIIEYVGTFAIGVLYLDKSVKIPTHNYINICV